MKDKFKPVDSNTMLNIFLSASAIVLCFFVSLDFFTKNLNLYLWDSSFTKENLIEFNYFLKGTFSLYLIVIIGPIIQIIQNYLYYYIDSKSIYLMKRLKNRYEMHMRSLTIPIIFLAIAIVTLLIGIEVCKSTYLSFVPNELLPINTDWSIWEALL